MINQKLVEGAIGMLARVIPPEEYAKASAALGQIVTLLKTIDGRMQRIEEATAGLRDRVMLLETAAMADSPAFSAAQSEQAMWMVPGSIEKALAPAVNGALNDH